MTTFLIVASSVFFVTSITFLTLWRTIVAEQKELEFRRTEDSIYRSMDQSFIEIKHKIEELERNVFAEITRGNAAGDHRMSDIERRLGEWEE
jgi:hypothetical protein